MGEYISSFGIRRYVGLGEGRDVKYDASAKPSLGLYKSIEIVVNGTGPVPNLGAKGYDGTQVAIPAGATVTYAYIVTNGTVTANGVTIKLVEKDGDTVEGAKTLFNGVDLVPGETLEVSEGVDGLDRYAVDMYAYATAGLVPGLDAKLIIEYI